MSFRAGLYATQTSVPAPTRSMIVNVCQLTRLKVLANGSRLLAFILPIYKR